MDNVHKHRKIVFDGAKNVRDLGGLSTVDGAKTRFGVIYRADGLSRLSEADIERLASFKLRSVIDLRYDEERERAPDRMPATNTPRLFHRGFRPRGTHELFAALNDHGADADTAFALMRESYSHLPFAHTAEMRDVMHHIIAPTSSPHLIHCTSGKDRTGVVVACILLAVRIPRETVIDDYQLSNTEHQAVDAFSDNADADAVNMVMSAREEYICAALDAIDAQCGNFDAYLSEHMRFGHSERRRLKSLLLE